MCGMNDKCLCYSYLEKEGVTARRKHQWPPTTYWNQSSTKIRIWKTYFPHFEILKLLQKPLLRLLCCSWEGSPPPPPPSQVGCPAPPNRWTLSKFEKVIGFQRWEEVLNITHPDSLPDSLVGQLSLVHHGLLLLLPHLQPLQQKVTLAPNVMHKSDAEMKEMKSVIFSVVDCVQRFKC